MILKIGMQHREREYYKDVSIITLGWPRPILRLVKFGHLGFCMGEK